MLLSMKCLLLYELYLFLFCSLSYQCSLIYEPFLPLLHIMKDNKYKIIKNDTRRLIVWVDRSIRESRFLCLPTLGTVRMTEILSHTHTQMNTGNLLIAVGVIV